MARSFVWIANGGGDWSNSSNWRDETDHPPQPGPPTSTDIALFGSGSGAGTLTGTGTARILQFQNTSGPWTLAADLTVGTLDAFVSLTVTGSIDASRFIATTAAFSIAAAGTVTAGQFQDNSGANIVVDGTLDASGGLIVATGLFTVGTGGVVKAAQFQDNAGADLELQAGSSLTLTGAGGLGLDITNIGTANDATINNKGADIEISSTAGASFTAEGGATVDALNTSIGTGVNEAGTLLLTGTSTSWTDTGDVTVGNKGTGILTVRSGATLTSDGAEDNIAAATGSAGSVTVDGAGSDWAAAGNIAVGFDGTGTLVVSDSGSAVAGGLLFVGVSAAASGTVTVASGGTLANSGTEAVIGDLSGASGAVTVTDTGSSWTDKGGLVVGAAGNGSLTISSGASVSAAEGLSVADNPHGSGVLTIENASTLSNGGDAVVANSASTTATATLEDTGSTWTDNEALIVGDAGAGALNIQDGASLSTGGTLDALGDIGSGSGTVTVTGSGSRWTSAGTVAVGLSGSGTLTISSGASVSVAAELFIAANPHSGGIVTIESGGTLSNGDTAVIANSASTTATVTVEDAGSTWADNGALIVGDAGAGALNIENGASVSAASVLIGEVKPGSGTILVTGASSSLSDTGALAVGNAGSGLLQIAAGAIVSAATASVGSQGTIALSGGTLDPAALTNAGAITGFGDIDDALANNGIVTAESGELDANGSISGSGSLAIDVDGTLDVTGSIGSSQRIGFGAADATLILGTPGSHLGNQITGLQDGDRIELAGISVSGAVFTPGGTADEGSITVTGSEIYIINDVTFAAGAATTFVTGHDSTTGNDYIQVACYLEGTHILTDKAEVPVESLAIGDRVITRSGEAKPIKWIGRRSYAGAFAAANPNLAPVLIRAGALAAGIPTRDLYVSPEHALYLSGVLVPARHLLNGASIQVRRDIDPILYFHIELAEHDVIYAEGAAAETFVDCDSRGIFHNAGEFASLYPDDTASRWRFCAPVVEAGKRLIEINRRLRERAASLGLLPDAPGTLEGFLDHADHAGVSGWAWTRVLPDTPVWLEVVVNDAVTALAPADHYRADLLANGIGNGSHAFELRFLHPLDPFTRHDIIVRRAEDGALLPNAPITIEPADGLDPSARAALGQLLRVATARAQTSAEAEALLQLLADEMAQARRARARLLRNDAPVRRRRGAAAPGRRALVIDQSWPRTDRDAGAQAIVSHMQALRRIGWQVSFAAANDSGADVARASLESNGITCHAWPAIGSIEELLRLQPDHYQLVYLHRLSIAAAYAGLARTHQPCARLLYNIADLHHLRLARQAAIEARPELARRAALLRRQELALLPLVDAVITHSPLEAALLARDSTGTAIRVVPWAVRPRPARMPWAQREGVLLVANFHHDPNVDGLYWLFREVMSLVWAEAPSLPLSVAGAGIPEGIAHGLTHERLHVFGAVPDLTPLLAGARLAVALLRYGAGIKGKVLEAWSAGLACAMTPIAAEGLTLCATLAGAVAADAPGLARLILDLHADETRNRAQARAGRALLRRHFSQKQLDATLAAAIGAKKSPLPLREDRAAKRIDGGRGSRQCGTVMLHAEHPRRAYFNRNAGHSARTASRFAAHQAES